MIWKSSVTIYLNNCSFSSLHNQWNLHCILQLILENQNSYASRVLSCFCAHPTTLKCDCFQPVVHTLPLRQVCNISMNIFKHIKIRYTLAMRCIRNLFYTQSLFYTHVCMYVMYIIYLCIFCVCILKNTYFGFSVSRKSVWETTWCFHRWYSSAWGVYNYDIFKA